MARSLAALSLSLSLLVLGGCKGDPSTPAYWERALEKSRRPEDRVRVLEELGASEHLKAPLLPLLHAQLTEEKSPEVRSAIARTLGQLKDPSSAKPLAEALQMGNTQAATGGVNREIITALASIGDPSSAPVLVKLLGGSDGYTRVDAIQALGAMRAPEAVEPLLALAEDEREEPFINKKAIEALGRLRAARAVPVLVRMMTRERRGVSFYTESSFALFQVGAPAAEALLPVLAGKDLALTAWSRKQGINPASYYFKSAQVLGDLREPRAEPALLERLRYTDREPGLQAIVRVHAAEALGRLRAGAARAPLSGMLHEAEPAVRDAYVNALVQLGGRESLPALEKSAASGNWFAREVAVKGLAQLGDARELTVLDALSAAEPDRTKKECAELDYEGCQDVARLGAAHAAEIASYKRTLEAARGCAEEPGCWAGKLKDSDRSVVERAARELTRAPGAAAVDALLTRVKDPDSAIRSHVIQALDFLVATAPEARTRASAQVASLEKQLVDEKGSTAFQQVNEDLRRLIVRLQPQL